MTDKKVVDMEDLMLDYGEMTSFDFDSDTYKEVKAIQDLENEAYTKAPVAFKYGKFVCGYVSRLHFRETM